VIAQPQRHAGQFLWVYNDYFALWNPNKPMGIVDAYRLPKQLYYRFRESFSGKTPDYPVAGLAARIDLRTDLAPLTADGADIAIVSATLRNAGGACVKSAANVTFAVSGPATAFGQLTRPAAAGRVAIVVRSALEPGALALRVW
jgi:hypothetical protein